MRIAARIHIVVGLFLALGAYGAELPVAESAHWATKIYLVALPNATAPVQVRATNCNGINTRTVEIVPAGGGALVPDLCYGAEFALIPADPRVDSLARLTYTNDAQRLSYVSGPLNPFRNSQRELVDGDEGTGTFFCSVLTPMTATVWGADNPFLWTFDYFECHPPVSQHTVKSAGLGFVKFSIGYEAIILYPALPDIHGFLTRTDAGGFGNGSTVPLKQTPVER